MKRSLLIAVTLLATVGSVFADDFSARVKAGVYYLDSKDEQVDQSLYQYHSLNASLKKNGVFALVSGSYSDIYKSRDAKYSTDYRLAMANVGYMTPSENIKGSVGRMYTTFLDRSVWWDGAQLEYQVKNMLTVQGFGGYSVPTAYGEDFLNSSYEFLTMGGSVQFTGVKNVVAIADYVKASDEDKGTAGLGVNAAIGKRYDLFTTGVWDLNSSSVKHANVSANVKVRTNDRAIISYTFDDAETDTTDYFDVLLHPTRSLVKVGYYFNVNTKLNMTLNYGLLMYEDKTGAEAEDVMAHMIDTKVFGYGAYLGYTKEFESYTNKQEITAGYEYKILDDLLTGVNAGYVSYTLGEGKEAHTAQFAAVVCEYSVIKNLWLNVEYEFLSNREYSQDHRVFVGLNYSILKGL